MNLNIGTLLMIVFLARSVSARENPTVRVDPRSFSFAAITVPDIGSSAAWYQRHFGLTKGFSYTADDKSVQVLVLSRPGLTIELQQHSDALPMPPPDGKAFLRHGIFKFGTSVSDVKDAVAKLEAVGTKVVVPPFKDQDGRYLSAIVADNSGNIIQLFQRISKREKGRE